MSSADSYIDAQEKLMTLNLLKMVFKKFETLEELRSYLHVHGVEVSVANLSRYINGKALPKSKLKDELLRVITSDNALALSVEDLIDNHIYIWTDEQGNIGVNNTYLLNDSKTLKAILFLAIHKGIIPRDVDKVITAEVDGIPVAMTLAHLLNIDCVYARRKKPLGTTNFIAEDIKSTSLGRVETIYFPEKFIRTRERVMIVDDVIRTGATQRALVDLVRQSGGIAIKIMSLIGIGKHWGKITELDRIPFRVLKSLPERK
jgi:adenine phosphoribosyltransferase